ncbi:CoA transferase [Rhodobacterales bacterium HKCCE2091]|nr:CoA transferase [Rhodobacterales bacterium HKCCE2091]
MTRFDGTEPVAPLSGVRVIDMGRYIAGPYCAALLGDLGADVVRIESPDGASDRDVMQLGDAGFGAMHAQVNRGKRSLALDTSSNEGRGVLDRLLSTADVLVVNMAPAALKRARLDHESLSRINPGIVLAAPSAYGFEGDHQNLTGFDTTGQALSGAMYLTGFGDPPLRAAYSFVDIATATYAAYATLGALMSRTRDGRGREVRSSLLASALSVVNPVLIEEATGARHRTPTGNRSPIAGPSDLFRVTDGWIIVQVLGDAMFERWCRMVERPELADDPRFATDQLRGDNGEALSAIMSDWLAGRSRAEALELLTAARIPGSAQYSPAEALDAPEVRDGGMIAWHEKAGLRYPVIAPAVRIGDDLSRPEPAPDLGAHSRQVLRDYGFSDDEIAALTEASLVAARDL